MIQRNEYPRPQMRRDDWLPLNGIWQFCFDDCNRGSEKKYFGGAEFDDPMQINVPFSYQYEASGIHDTQHHPYLWYKRTFELSEQQRKQSVLLCFNAVDYICDVWVNGMHVASHEGGFAPFSCDITQAVAETNEIVVRCYDPLDPTIPRGKQSWINDPFACWYVPNSGIWQSVWIEFFNRDCVERLTLTPDIDTCCVIGEIVTMNDLCDRAELVISYKDKVIKTCDLSLDGKYTRFCIKLMELDFVDESFFWSPEQPNLFYVDTKLFIGKECADTVGTRFGMRKISVDEHGNICLNNRLLYQRLILDQGYFEESGLTPPSAQALKDDILLAKEMGYNGARKHQKFEDPYFYYYAEELGYLTWCEMPSAFNFNTDEQAKLMMQWQQIVNVAMGFTSVICYVPLNESWGVRKILTDADQQNFARAMYYITKAQDASRLVSTNDGWENVSQTDIISIHDYAFDGSEFAKKYRKEMLDSIYPQGRKLMCVGNHYDGQPVLMTEFGGIAMQSPDGENGDWGYNTKARSDEEFYTRYGNLMTAMNETLFQGFCYTQLSDVQQEVNGLLDKHHKPKFDTARIRSLTLGK